MGRGVWFRLPDKESWEDAHEEEESQADSAGLLWYLACGAGGRLGALPNEVADKMKIQENLQHDCAVHHSEDRLDLKYDSGSQTWKLLRDHKHTSEKKNPSCSKYPAGRATPRDGQLCVRLLACEAREHSVVNRQTMLDVRMLFSKAVCCIFMSLCFFIAALTVIATDAEIDTAGGGYPPSSTAGGSMWSTDKILQPNPPIKQQEEDKQDET